MAKLSPVKILKTFPLDNWMISPPRPTRPEASDHSFWSHVLTMYVFYDLQMSFICESRRRAAQTAWHRSVPPMLFFHHSIHTKKSNYDTYDCRFELKTSCTYRIHKLKAYPHQLYYSVHWTFDVLSERWNIYHLNQQPCMLLDYIFYIFRPYPYNDIHIQC